MSSDITAVTLKSIAVTPTPTSLYANTTEALTATGTYSNATTQVLTSTATWTSSNTNVASVSGTGVVTTIAPGTATITAASGTVKGKATVKVLVTLTSIAVTPATTTLPANTTQVLKATGSYDNKTTKNLTSTVAWTSTNPSVATVSSAGQVVTVAPGTATIMATTSTSANAPVVGMATITVDAATVVTVAVTPATKKIPNGTSQQFTATATFSDGTKQALVPPVVSWASSVPTVATVSASGLGSSVAVGGPLAITAKQVATGVSGAATLTVTAATLVSVAVTPSTSSVSAGLTQQFAATGTYTDGSTMDITSQVTWGSSATAVATVSSAGLATSVTAGTSTITATDPKTKKASTATLTVTPAVLQSIAVSPAFPSVPAGLTSQLDAVGTWTDGTTQDVTATDTWTSSAPSVATVSNASGSQGLVSALTKGTTTITVADPTTGVMQSVTVMVTPGLLVSVAVTPANPSVPLDTTAQLVATATYTDGSTANVSQSVNWVSTTGSIAVANAPGPAGQVTSLSLGSSVVSATDPTSGISGQTTVTASPAILESLSITPATVNILTGQTQQLTATGTMSDGSMVAYTGTVTWASTSASVYVSNAAGQSLVSGLAIGVSVGTATVSATDPVTGVTASVNAAVSINTNDDAAQEFSAYVNPVGDWSYGWATAPGAAFNAFSASYNSGGASLDYWDGSDSSGQPLYAAHNPTASPQTFDDAPVAAGQLVLLPPSVATDTSSADARWTAPAQGVYQVTATFSGTSDQPLCNPVTTCTSYPYGCNPYVCGEYICGSYQCNGYCCGFDFFGACIGNYCYDTCYNYCNEVCYQTCYSESCQTSTVCTTPSTTTSVGVFQNGEPVFSGFINLDGAGNAQTYTSSLSLNAGDTLDFEVGNGGDGNAYDLTIFDAQVQTCASAGLTACGSTCTNTANDPNNCGACGNACTTSDPNAQGATCEGGVCVINCDAGFVLCNGVCSNEQTDTNNCGGCGLACPAGEPCQNGACVVVPKYVFVSSQVYTGNLGGLAGADATCQALASNPATGLTGTYKAWLSSDTVSAASRLSQASVPYVLVNGNVVANNWASLTSGTLLHAIDTTELNGPAPSSVPDSMNATAGCGTNLVWTNTRDDGSLGNNGESSCSDWTDGSDSLGGGNGADYGTSNSVTNWSGWCEAGGCDGYAALFCIEQ